MRRIIRRIAEKCYIPANRIILDMIKVAAESLKWLSISVLLSNRWTTRSEVIDSFKELQLRLWSFLRNLFTLSGIVGRQRGI